MSIKVSIIIANYEYSRYFPRVFRSLALQTFDMKDVEIIVVDDGSRDDSVAVIKELGRGLNVGHFVVQKVRHLGQPGAVRNVGMKMAKGEYFLCLDPDDELEPHFLSCTVEALDKYPAASLAFSDYYEVTGAQRRLVELPQFSVELLRTQNTLTLATLFRRSVYERSRGFATNTTYEDWDFWIQAALNKFMAVRIPYPLFTYNHHESNYSLAARQQDGLSKANIVLNNKWFFEPDVIAWARAHLRGVPWAIAFKRGLIPRGQDVKNLRAIGNLKVVPVQQVAPAP